MPDAVRFTSELERIIKLPRRTTDAEHWQSIAAELTQLLKTPAGTQSLRISQAQALHDFGTCRGAFCPIGVGEGKTLISLLAPYVVDARRTLLLLPASLIEKTRRDWEKYAKHWLIPNSIRLFSYEMLGREQSALEIEQFDPDLIMADEVHRLKNRKAACTRRVDRQMKEKPDTMFLALSGTIMSKSLLDFGHVLRWCLKDGAPVPRTQEELEEWASALDEKVDNEAIRLEPGALLNLLPPEIIARPPPDLTPTKAARRGFRSRLVETPGVVSTIGEGERVDASIYVKAIKYDVQPITNAHFAKLRDKMLTPDDWQLMTGADVWRHARELALGLHYVWCPRPPEEWRRARKEWNAFVREVLSHSRTLDSELQVAHACDDGKLPNEQLERWRAAKATGYKPNTEPRWHDDSALKKCAEWMRKPGIVWTEHEFFARRLAELTGAAYYGAKGLDAQGRYIEDADGKHAIIASIDANKDGKNLQHAFDRLLYPSPPPGALVWQQSIARVHRPGQRSDEVQVDVFTGCSEHLAAWRSALAGAEHIKELVGADSKLLSANVVYWPDDIEVTGWMAGSDYTAARWRKVAYVPNGDDSNIDWESPLSLEEESEIE